MHLIRSRSRKRRTKTMEPNKNSLTKADELAIERKDDTYINAKGANLYRDQSYAQAVEYYHLGAAMGNSDSISNLGYCYLYGRDIPQNTALAVAYFKIACEKKNPDAAYKLGDIYSKDKWGLEDKELSLYYYSLAVEYIIGPCWQTRDSLYYNDELQNFPSLCFALARELGNEGNMFNSTPLSYQFLLYAKLGYENELANGFGMYEKAYDNVLDLMENPQYDEVRDYYNSLYLPSDDDGFYIERPGDEVDF